MGVRGRLLTPSETPVHADSNKLLVVSIALILTEILMDFDHSSTGCCSESDWRHHEKKADKIPCRSSGKFKGIGEWIISGGTECLLGGCKLNSPP